MTIATSLDFMTSNDGTRGSIAVWRLYLLRAGYLLIAVGMGMQMVPAFLHHGPWMLDQGVKNAMLLALVTLSVVGIRYPLKMLPLLFWEITWKTVWLLTVALPAWQSGTLNADTAETTFAASFVWIFFAVVPWDYAWRNFVVAK